MSKTEICRYAVECNMSRRMKSSIPRCSLQGNEQLGGEEPSPTANHREDMRT